MLEKKVSINKESLDMAQDGKTINFTRLTTIKD